MKMRPHCFLRPILRPAAVFALAFGVTSLMLSAQDETVPADADTAVTETAEEPASEAEEVAVEADAEAESHALLAQLVGGVALARAVGDPALSDALLADTHASIVARYGLETVP